MEMEKERKRILTWWWHIHHFPKNNRVESAGQLCLCKLEREKIEFWFVVANATCYGIVRRVLVEPSSECKSDDERCVCGCSLGRVCRARDATMFAPAEECSILHTPYSIGILYSILYQYSILYILNLYTQQGEMGSEYSYTSPGLCHLIFYCGSKGWWCSSPRWWAYLCKEESELIARPA